MELKTSMNVMSICTSGTIQSKSWYFYYVFNSTKDKLFFSLFAVKFLVPAITGTIKCVKFRLKQGMFLFLFTSRLNNSLVELLQNFCSFIKRFQYAYFYIFYIMQWLVVKMSYKYWNNEYIPILLIQQMFQ